jgi:G3E family GTPase
MSKHKFEYMFVESSGLGDPSNVEEILEAAKAISDEQYEFKGAICLVDSVNFFDQIDDLETVHRQLKHCHLAVLTKVDLVNSSTINKLKEKIREINPSCRIDISSNGNLDLKFLNEDLMQYKWVEGEETTNSVETKPKTLFMNFDGVVEKEKLELFLREIEPNVYRVKGFFNLSDLGWNQIDLVGKQIDYKTCEQQEKSQFVFISKIGPSLIKKIYEAWNKYIGLEMQLKN